MYKFISFGGVALPNYDPETQQDPAPARVAFVDTMAGGYSSLGGANAALVLPYNITYTTYARADNAAALRAIVDPLRGKIGKRLLLKRRAIDVTTDEQVCYATLTSMPYVKAWSDILHVKLSLNFTIESRWYGKGYSDWLTETGETLDFGGTHYGTSVNPSPGSPIHNSFELVIHSGDYAGGISSSLHKGTLPIADAVVKITMGAGESTTRISAFGTVATHSFVPGDVIIIDSGAMTVTKNGTSIMADVTWGEQFQHHGFWRIDPPVAGGVLYGVGLGTGGEPDYVNTTIDISYLEQWA